MCGDRMWTFQKLPILSPEAVAPRHALEPVHVLAQKVGVVAGAGEEGAWLLVDEDGAA